ncbi:MAG: FMN-binding protein [Lachnospiraceae bacterium]|nr:FMN-binding protein [Lachnospiraceae bacterium]
MKRMLIIVLILVSMMSLTACGEQTGLQDGYYTAQASEFSHGWKEYITIMVKGGSIVSVEYNAENASGFIKSWDNAYMQAMLHGTGTYPNEYTRYYAGQLLDGQGEGTIDALTGATSSYGSFQKLEAAVIEQAKQGDSSIVIVDTAH